MIAPNRRFLLAALVLAALPACPETVDNPRPDGSRDASAADGPSDGPGDAGAGDGGPCGGACGGATPVCRESDGTCVACLDDTGCSETTPICNADGQCEACDEDADCAAIPATPTCDETSGACVECTLDDGAACGGNVCDSRMHTCTTDAPGSAGACRACVADAQCMTGMLCVDMTYGGNDVGSYCLWRIDAASPGPAGDCSSTRPYFQPMADAESVDGASATVCTLALATCEAVRDFRTGGRGGASCELDGDPDQCGLDAEADATCVMVDATTNSLHPPLHERRRLPRPSGRGVLRVR